MHRIVYGIDLLAHGWRTDSTYDERTGDRLDLTSTVAANAATFRRAVKALDDVLQPLACVATRAEVVGAVVG